MPESKRSRKSRAWQDSPRPCRRLPFPSSVHGKPRLGKSPRPIPFSRTMVPASVPTSSRKSKTARATSSTPPPRCPTLRPKADRRGPSHASSTKSPPAAPPHPSAASASTNPAAEKPAPPTTSWTHGSPATPPRSPAPSGSASTNRKKPSKAATAPPSRCPSGWTS